MPNSHCHWVIEPTRPMPILLPNGDRFELPQLRIVLRVVWIDTEPGFDIVSVYDHPDARAENGPVAEFTGHDTPRLSYAETGTMIVVFLSDDSIQSRGFQAEYYLECPGSPTADAQLDCGPYTVAPTPFPFSRSPTAAPTSSPPRCVDDAMFAPQCKEWALSGQCKLNLVFMVAFCRSRWQPL